MKPHNFFTSFATGHSKFLRINIVNFTEDKMKKQTLLIATLILTVALSACGSSSPQAPAEPATATEAFSQLTEEPTATESTIPATEAPAATETTPAAESTSAGVSFAADIKPIFDTRCIKCHGVERTKEGLDMQTYENILAGSNNGPVIEPGNADNSLLVQLIVDGEMPDRGDPVTPDELQLIINWINQGALNN